jgi:putative Mn2+ efflux pump MntP
MLTYLLVAVGLSMDAFAVSVSSGICIKEMNFRYAFRASSFFGLFQFLMPIAGWLLGETFRVYIQRFDHWIAFGLLAVVGGKMIVESLGKNETEACDEEGNARKSILDLKTLLVLSVATSIDALAVGLSYSMLGEPILLPSLIIGAITFALCLVGVEFGKRIGAKFERWAELAGGIVLVGIGAKIAIEHFARRV